MDTLSSYIYLSVLGGPTLIYKSVPLPSVGHDRCKILPQKTTVLLSFFI